MLQCANKLVPVVKTLNLISSLVSNMVLHILMIDAFFQVVLIWPCFSFLFSCPDGNHLGRLPRSRKIRKAPKSRLGFPGNGEIQSCVVCICIIGSAEALPILCVSDFCEQ